MSIRAWSDTFVSGFTKIDTQHKKLFQMLSSFAEKNGDNASTRDILTLLDELGDYCKSHFHTEESVMEQYGFPLIEYHRGLHKNLKRALIKMRKMTEQHAFKDPHTSVVKVCADWFYNHIALEDLTFASFYKNRDYSLGEHFVGRKCELLTVDNKFLGTGDIQSVDRSEVVVSNSTGSAIPLNLNEIVKVKSISGQHENQTFLARVFFSTPEIIKLFNATVIQTVNNRQHFRVSVKLNAKLLKEELLFNVTITDISEGGLMIDSKKQLEVGDIVTIYFEAQGVRFVESCEVVRAVNESGSSSTYGIRFLSMKNSDADKINSFVLNKQAEARRQYRKSLSIIK